MHEIYLDNAAAAPMTPEVKKSIKESLDIYGNPSSFNEAGRRARLEIKESRLLVARFFGAHQDEIIFTGSGSESNNLAIFGSIDPKNKPEIITSNIEHPSVRVPLCRLADLDCKIKEVKVDKEGLVSPEDIGRLITNKTVLVSIMYANNEIGSIQPIVQIGKYIKEWREKNKTIYPLFHVDACQAVGYLDCNANRLGADLITFNGSKIGGPRGIGGLYVRRGIPLRPLIFGGEQENALRAGTENVQGIIGLAKAFETLNPKKEIVRLSELRDYFFETIIKILPDIKINGPLGIKRLPNNINMSIPGITSENILIELDKYNIRAGSGSACTSHSVAPSHVIAAMGLDKKYLSGVLRVSMGWQTKKSDIDFLLKVLPKTVQDLKSRYKIVKT